MNQEEILEHYRENRNEIDRRLEQFEELRGSDNTRMFKELVFVILTSQSGARNAWRATEQLDEQSLINDGLREDIAEVLAQNEIQYETNKAGYIVENRNYLSQPTLKDPSGALKLKEKIKPERLDSTREWMVENLKGVSWKGASHFLRNIGYGNGFAIISSRIANKMYELDLRDSPDLPKNREEYIDMEKKLREFSEEQNIDIKAMDLVMWSMETGEVFK